MTLPDRLIAALRRCCQSLPDARRGKNATYPMADFALGAFAAFFMQSPSFLAHQRHLETGHGRSNCQTLFGMRKIPGDGQIRAMLDPVEPSRFFPVFADIVTEFRASGGLDAMRCLDGRTAIAPGHTRAVPLEPEFVIPQDGHDKQDCESRAVRRWLAAHGARYRDLDPIALGGDLFSRQPICEAVLAVGWHFLFVCKPDSHPSIEDFLAGAEIETSAVRARRGKKWTEYRYHWLNKVPLRGDEKAIEANWLSIEIRDGAGKTTYRNAFVTDMEIGRDNVAEIAAVGRARWKVENETFNVLKTKGYNLEHNFGHGKRHLATVLATLNLLAFACHTVCDLGDRTWRAARRELVVRQGFFQALANLTIWLVFPDWGHLLDTMAFVRPPPQAP